jgi:hypothetical protein
MAMQFSRWLSLILVVGVPLTAGQFVIYPPIPVVSPEHGFRYNPPGPFVPALTLEMFIDLHCPDSFANLPILERVADNYGNMRLNLVIQHVPLSYHRNAFLALQGLYVIRDQRPFETFAYMHAMLRNNANFSTDATVAMSETQVLEMMADVTVQATTIERETFINQIGSWRATAVRAWKYAIKRQMSGTPSYAVNGVSLDLTGDPTYDDWIRFLDPLVD